MENLESSLLNIQEEKQQQQIIPGLPNEWLFASWHDYPAPVYLLIENRNAEALWYSLDSHGTFRRLPPIQPSTPLSFITQLFAATLSGCSMAQLNGFLYAVGGAMLPRCIPTAFVWRYRRSNRWSSVALKTTPRVQCRTGVINGLLYVVGGFDSASAKV